MLLSNTLILRGENDVITEIHNEMTKLLNKDKTSKLYDTKINKNIKKLTINDITTSNYLYNLKITFLYTARNIEEFINLFKNYNAEIIHMCSSRKSNVWIVNKYEYIREFQLIPAFAVSKIIYDYMAYIESAVVLDTYETLKFDRNERQIVINEKKLSDAEMETLLFDKTLKGKPLIEVLEQFVNNYHEKCINTYQELYSINKEENTANEEPSPLGLIVVTFGILGILALFLYFMGYLNF